LLNRIKVDVDKRPQNLSAIIFLCAKLGKHDPELSRLVMEAAKDTHMNGAQPQNLANLAWGLGKLGLKDEPLFSLISTNAIACIGLFKDIELVQISQGFAEAGISRPRLFAEIGLELVVNKKINTLGPQGWTSLARSYANLEADCTELFMRISALSIPQIKAGSFSYIHLANLANAFAKIKKIDSELFKEIAKQVEVVVNDLDPQALVELVQAYSHVTEIKLLDILVPRIKVQIFEFSSFGLAYLAQNLCYAGDHKKYPELLAEIATAAIGKISQFNAREFYLTAHAFATAEIKHPALFNSIATEAIKEKHREDFTAKELCLLFWSFVKLEQNDVQLMGMLEKEIADKLSHYDASDLCLIAWCLMQIKSKNNSLFQALMNQFWSLESIIEPYDFQMMVSALARSELEHSILTPFFAHYEPIILQNVKNIRLGTLLEIVKAYAQIGYKKRPFYTEIKGEIEPQLKELSPSQLVSLVYAFRHNIQIQDHRTFYAKIVEAIVDKKGQFILKQLIFIGLEFTEIGVDDPRILQVIEDLSPEMGDVPSDFLILNLKIYGQLSILNWNRIEVIVTELAARIKRLNEEELSVLCYNLAVLLNLDKEKAWNDGNPLLHQFMQELEGRKSSLLLTSVRQITITLQYLRFLTFNFDPTAYQHLYSEVKNRIDSLPQIEESSRFHREVTATLKGILPSSVKIEMEVPIGAYSLDHLIDEKVALEVDGPHHVLLSGKIPGQHQLKENILAALGYRMRHVLTAKWLALFSDLGPEEIADRTQKNEAYLRDLLPEFFWRVPASRKQRPERDESEERPSKF
jgi:hypothetical protein